MHSATQTLENRCRTGFTLIEMIAVLVLVSILSVTAIPSLARLDSARDAAMMSECDRLLRFAQAAAVSSGLPSGLQIDLDAQTLAVITIGPDGHAVPLNRDVTGQQVLIHLPEAFGAATLVDAGVTGSLSDRGEVAIWFDYDGRPHTRDSDGSDPRVISQPFIMRSASERTISVLPLTGKVER